MAELVQFLIGVVLLCLGASWLVRGASAIAGAFGIPKHVIGLTLVALGTSAPEFFVNVLAALEGKTEFALSNVSGSNLANLCMGFGICALVANVRVRRREFGSDVTLNWIAPLVVLLLMFSNAKGDLPFLVVIPLSCFLIYYAYSLRGRKSVEDDESKVPTALPIAAVAVVAGLLALYFGGEWVLHAAVATAQRLQVPEDVIGLTVVALGTSVPDITASAVAARKGEHGIAVGNIVGSNISNLLVVLNSTIAVSGAALTTNPGIRMDYVAVTLISFFCWFVAITFESIPRWAGWVLVISYVLYLVSRVCF